MHHSNIILNNLILNNHFFILFTILGFVTISLHTVALLDCLLKNFMFQKFFLCFSNIFYLTIVVFSDRPGDILIKICKMIQKTGQSLTVDKKISDES